MSARGRPVSRPLARTLRATRRDLAQAVLLGHLALTDGDQLSTQRSSVFRRDVIHWRVSPTLRNPSGTGYRGGPSQPADTLTAGTVRRPCDHPPPPPLPRATVAALDTDPAALVPYGWNARAEDLLAAILGADADGLVPGRVVHVERIACRVVTGAGELLATGDPLPAVGDWVTVSVGSAPVVRGVAERWSTLTRLDPHGDQVQVLAANVDLVLITCPADRPASPGSSGRRSWPGGAGRGRWSS